MHCYVRTLPCACTNIAIETEQTKVRSGPPAPLEIEQLRLRVLPDLATMLSAILPLVFKRQERRNANAAILTFTPPTVRRDHLRA